MWNEENNSLQRKFEFDSFEKAIEFIQSASAHISKLNHHPEWTNVYNTVDVVLRTHDAGNTVTEKDRKLAAILDDVYCQYQ